MNRYLHNFSKSLLFRVANFFGDVDLPKGFAKNGDTIATVDLK